MGRSKNNDGKTAYYQTSPILTQKNLDMVIKEKQQDRINAQSFAVMSLIMCISCTLDGPPGTVFDSLSMHLI
jgi:hypothetical protein